MWAGDIDLLKGLGYSLLIFLCCASPFIIIAALSTLSNRVMSPSEYRIRQQIAKYEALASKGDLVAYERWKYWVQVLEDCHYN